MSFNFFGGPTETTQYTNGALAAALSGEAASSKIDDESSSLFGLKQSFPSEYSENTAPNLPTLDDISFMDIVKQAVLFRREKYATAMLSSAVLDSLTNTTITLHCRTEEEIHSNWLETRDKMGLAYKKKRREVIWLDHFALILL